MQTDFQKREIALKLVYYGPPLSGKTTNLQVLHERLDPRARGRLLLLDTRDDRTLFFDLLPVILRAQGLTVRIKLYTVPGQVMHQTTRKLVLQGADGVAFIADSRRSETRANNASWADLKSNLRGNAIDPAHFPTVIQFNKRDLPDVRSDEDMALLAQRGPEPQFPAAAIQGAGVVETFLGLMQLVWAHVDAQLGLEARWGLNRAELFDHLVRQLGAVARSVFP